MALSSLHRKSTKSPNNAKKGGLTHQVSFVDNVKEREEICVLSWLVGFKSKIITQFFQNQARPQTTVNVFQMFFRSWNLIKIL